MFGIVLKMQETVKRIFEIVEKCEEKLEILCLHQNLKGKIGRLDIPRLHHNFTSLSNMGKIVQFDINVENFKDYCKMCEIESLEVWKGTYISNPMETFLILDPGLT